MQSSPPLNPPLPARAAFSPSSEQGQDRARAPHKPRACSAATHWCWAGLGLLCIARCLLHFSLRSLCSMCSSPHPLHVWWPQFKPLTAELAWKSSPAGHRYKHCATLASTDKLAGWGACYTMQFMSWCSVCWVRPPSLKMLYYRFLENLKTFH